MGEAIVSGRYLNAKKVHIQELTTSIAFRKMNFCTAKPENGTKANPFPTISGAMVEKTIKGKKMRAPVRFEKNKTGNTALFSSDFFLNIS